MLINNSRIANSFQSSDYTKYVNELVNRRLSLNGGTLVGQLKLYGLGVAWDDLRTPINALKLSGVKPPTWTDYKGSQVLAFSDQAVLGNEEHAFFSMQLPHNYKEGTDITVHVHWIPEDDAGGNVYWRLDHSWANIGDTFPAETTIYVAGAAGTTADAHLMTTFADLTGTGKTISSMILCMIRRTSSNALDTYNGKSAYLLEVDAHYQIDSLGSSTATAK